MGLNYIVIEDELIARQRLSRLVETLRPGMNLLASCGTVREAVRLLGERPDVQLVFMDIELADGNCFEIFERTEVTAPVIFTTAYNDFALRAFEVYSLDYLLKPISETDMARALDKFDRVARPQRQDWQDVGRFIERDMQRQRQRILIVSGDTFAYVNVTDVAMFEAEDGYVSAVLHDGQRKMTNFTSMPEVMESLDPVNFFQITRSRILNIDAIAKVSKYFRGRLLVKFRIAGRLEEDTVSSTRRKEFLEWLGN